MRRIVLAAAVLTTALATPGHATPCAAYADAQTADALVSASGSLSCAGPDQLTLTVCIEALRPDALRWAEVECGLATGSSATSLWVSIAVCYQETGLVRATAIGTSSTGTWYAAGAPTLAPGAGSCGP